MIPTATIYLSIYLDMNTEFLYQKLKWQFAEIVSWQWLELMLIFNYTIRLKCLIYVIATKAILEFSLDSVSVFKRD